MNKKIIQIGIPVLITIIGVSTLWYLGLTWHAMYSNLVTFNEYKEKFAKLDQEKSVSTLTQKDLVDSILLSQLDQSLNHELNTFTQNLQKQENHAVSYPDQGVNNTSISQTVTETSNHDFLTDMSLKIDKIDLYKSIYLSDVTKMKDEAELYKEIEGDLLKGVVQFPGLKLGSGEKGVRTIYAHSSQYWGQEPYAFFDKLAFLKEGDFVSVDDHKAKKSYKYEVIASYESEIHHVDESKKEFWDKNDNEYLFLVTCWPINSDKKRWVVITKKVD